MGEWRLFPAGTVPECTTAEWYKDRERAPHLEQPGHRERLHATAKVVMDLLLGDREIRSVVDLGCGDGGLMSLLRDMHVDPGRGVYVHGYDVSPEAVRGAQERGVQAELVDVMHDEPLWGDLAICTEMLEHQVDPHGFLQRVRRASRYIVASSPWTESDRSHYEFHTWAWDHEGYRAMFRDTGWYVLAHQTVQSFQILAARKS